MRQMLLMLVLLMIVGLYGAMVNSAIYLALGIILNKIMQKGQAE